MPKKQNDQVSRGLTDREVKSLHLKHGFNVIESDQRFSALKVLLSQFTSPLIYILLIAAIITWFLGDLIDTGVIMAAVIVNTVLGFYQEYKAQKSLEALSQVLSPKATVIRDGHQQEIDATDLVPGDYVIIQSGMRIPADGVIAKHKNFSVNEAILTGESQSVTKTAVKTTANLLTRFVSVKHRTDTKGKESVYLGTIVQSGRAEMVVTFTGHATQVGQIATALKETSEVLTPLQQKIKRLSSQLAIMVTGVALLITLIGVATGNSFQDIFTLSVAIAVAAIPEGLAVSLTAILAIGMQRILKRRAIVRKLVAAEVLGSVTVICADKTGTITEGKMKVTHTDTTSQIDLVTAAVLGNDLNDPLEISMWEWAKTEIKKLKTISSIDWLVNKYPIIDIFPFNPKHRFAAKMTSGTIYIVGAPEILLKEADLSSKERKSWQKKIDDFAKQGFRLVGFATKHTNDNKIASSTVLTKSRWLGLMVFQDPIRDGVAKALKKTNRAGIDTKVITGDYLETALAIMSQLGYHLEPNQIMEGHELTNIAKSDLAARLKIVKLFARTTPEQKLKIVTALQESGQVVAMTGDGVNDAPALKKADIGIVVSTASDVSKETADMVLLDDNFATITAAIEEGRGIFSNLRKVIVYLLADAFSEIFIIVSSLILGLPLPVTAAQILWINFIDDGFPNLALTIDPKEKGLLKLPPIPKETQILDKEVKTIIALVSVSASIMVLTIFNWYNNHYTFEYARTMAFTVLAISTLFYVFSTRSLHRPIWLDNIFQNKWLVISVLVGFILQAMVVYVPILQTVFKTVPLKLADWLVVGVSGLVIISVIEVVKWAFIHDLFNTNKARV